MPTTLKRQHRQNLTLRRSFLETVKDKILPSLFHGSREQWSQPLDSKSHIQADHPTYYPQTPSTKRTAKNAVHHTTHHIRTLPPEILAYIWVLGAHEDSQLPTTVSHVCHFWRELSLRTPALWCRVTFTTRATSLHQRFYLARSCPLDVVLQEPARRPFNFYEVQRYMYLVSSRLHMWRSFDLNVVNYTPYLCNAALSECCSSNHSHAPVMEELSLIYRKNDDTKEFCLFSGYAPRLRRLTIDGIRLTWLPSLFQNLTYLHYTHHRFSSGNQAIQEIASVLGVTIRLVHLRLLFPDRVRRPRASTRITSTSDTIRLEGLKTLHFRVEGANIPDELLHLSSLLYTPKLTTLSLIDLGNLGQPVATYLPFPSLTMFLTLYAFPPMLRALYVEHRWHSEAIVPLLRSLGNLQQVVIKKQDAGDQVFTSNPRRRRRGIQY
ncbi:hypothetical protein Moror_12405 [Moniliophthora roreri MCA 2997]|uniref:Uncharacterized protein n=2 Tax=Moniliophthora roreri TaxID=221103 RepID=V2X9E1_MONRO|nr:hypothetical protein Moror_12405 [Moniliophthora roreri MCA 2997]KAI3616322.1 hypothetical protein WG66_013989 [Moniliophthora roreri]